MSSVRRIRIAVVTALVPFAAEAAAPGQLFYERTLMAEAGERCGLFTPQVAAALAASAQQARGAALRAGADRTALAAVEDRARRRAAAASCGSPDLALGAERVRAAFAGYARMTTMSFPGDSGSWTADRASPAWRLSQSATSASGPVVFGMAGQAGNEALVAVAAWSGALAASGARVLVRDPAKASSPYLDARLGGLAGRIPPRSVSVAYLASARAPAGADLLPPGSASGAAFRFPPALARALEGLDPREALVLELVYPARNGERVERVALEVGDFAAGRAFLTAGG